MLCCDRSHYRSDVCYLRGDVRTDPSTSSVFLYGAVPFSAAVVRVQHEFTLPIADTSLTLQLLTVVQVCRRLQMPVVLCQPTSMLC
jgi:hypothetical protein